MTRGDLIDIALKILGADDEVARGREWLDLAIREVEMASITPPTEAMTPILTDDIAGWEFLETSTTYQTVDGTNSVTFATMSITDYSKGMRISSANVPRELRYVKPTRFFEMRDTTADNPRYFTILEDTLELFPEPESGAVPLLTLRYFKKATLPTADTDELTTTIPIPVKYEGVLVWGVVAIGAEFLDDDRADKFRQRFVEKLNLMRADNANR